jgi:hypothetical protein
MNANIQDLENTIQEIKDDLNVLELKNILRRYARQAIADISA